MEGAEPSSYEARLRAEFDGCDSTASGYLDREELTDLSRRLRLEARLPLLLDHLLGERPFGRVNFEEFKNGLVSVLSCSLDLGASEDDSSYLEPAVPPQEVKPKFLKGTKRYGRRSRPEGRPDTGSGRESEDAAPSRTAAVSTPPCARRAKLRRSTSLESVESLKSDEETGSPRIDPPSCHNKGLPLNRVRTASERRVCSTAGRQQEDVRSRGLMAAACDRLAPQDADVLLGWSDGRGLWCPAPTLSSTPLRSADLQRAPLWTRQLVPEDGPARSASPVLLMATVGQRVLTRLDDGSGCSSPERVAALWTEEGIRNSREILMALDFPLEERLSLADLTLVLDNELLAGGDAVHQAALVSYKDEVRHLREVAERACRERDKLRADLDRADERNRSLVQEVDDRHASMETLNESRIRDLEQDFRDRLSALRRRAERDAEALMQQAELERCTQEAELQRLRGKEAELQDELATAAQERQCQEEELCALQSQLREAEGSVKRLQSDLDQLLNHRFGGLDPSGAGQSQEERFCQLIREYELQCRDLLDRNDELNSELELLKTRRSSRTPPAEGDLQNPDSDDPAMKSSSSSAEGAGTQQGDRSVPGGAGPAVSIQAELALQQLQETRVQLETQVNYYERQLDLMRQNMEVERKDICQAFKLEISELEENKARLELQVAQLKETVARLQNQNQSQNRGGEVERRMQRERAELEQNFAREIGNLVQRLSAEKDQLEAELKLQMDQEVMRARVSETSLEAELQQLREKEAGLLLQVELLRAGLCRSPSPTVLPEAQKSRTELDRDRLVLENRTYMRLADQLSTQIVEMEDEASSLRQNLSDTADLVLDQRRALSDSQNHLELEKERLAQRLMELENLVLDLEVLDLRDATEGAGPHRTQLEEVRCENAALQERLTVLQQQVQNLEDEAEKGRRRRLEAEEEHRQSREEAERLHAENSRYRQEVLDLSRRNLQLSSANSDLGNRLHGEQESVRMLQECLATVSREQQGAAAAARRLETQLSSQSQLEAELRDSRHQLQNVEAELSETRKKLKEVEAELSGSKENLQRDAESRRHQVEQLDERVAALQDEGEHLRLQLLDATQEKLDQAQEVAELRRKLREAVHKVEETQVDIRRLTEEKEEERHQYLEVQQQALRSGTALSTAKAQQLHQSRSQERLDRDAAALQARLTALRSALQEKVQELREQMERNIEASRALKDLYVENGQLMAALQLTERRQKQAEKKSFMLEEKVAALHVLLREVVAAALCT